MKRSIFRAVSIAALLCAPMAFAAEPGAGAPNAGKPVFGTFGIATEFMDQSVRPGDDFFRFVNGKWIDSFVIPSDQSNYGQFTYLRIEAEERVKQIIEDAAAQGGAKGTAAQRIADYYKSYLDEAAIEAKGLAPIAPMMAKIAAAATPADIAALMGDVGFASVIGGFVNVDSKQPDRYIAYMGQSGLGLPDRAYYLEDASNFPQARSAYRGLIVTLLGAAEIAGAEAAADDILAFETEIAKLHWDRVKSRNRDLTYNLRTRAALKTAAPDFAWDRFLEAQGYATQNEFVVSQIDAVEGLARLVASTNVATLQNYLRFHALRTNADVLPKAFDAAVFDVYGKLIGGQQEQRARWRRAVGAVEGAMGQEVGKIYVDRHFGPAQKAGMDALVDNLREAFAERLAKLDWMGEATRQEALAKLAAFTPKIGFPDKWRDFSGLEVVAGDAFGNADRAARFNIAYNRARLGQPIDKDEWGMLPQTVNASYNPPRNEITFPAGILQPPFFDLAADPAVNYGAIGAVIGHEIGHGFDDQGRKSDGTGQLREWWTPEDEARFEEKATKFVEQYSAFEALPGLNLNGRLGLGENLGDLGGLNMAYAAYKRATNGQDVPVIDGFTGDQRFFMAWAQVWRIKWTEAALRRQVVVGPHSPGQFRVLGIVRNMDEWYQAFDVKPTDTLYLPPEQRVRIW